MIPLTFLYDEYIDRPKFTEQKKKNPFEYIVPSPSSGVGTKIPGQYGIFTLILDKLYIYIYVYVNVYLS